MIIEESIAKLQTKIFKKLDNLYYLWLVGLLFTGLTFGFILVGYEYQGRPLFEIIINY